MEMIKWDARCKPFNTEPDTWPTFKQAWSCAIVKTEPCNESWWTWNWRGNWVGRQERRRWMRCWKFLKHRRIKPVTWHMGKLRSKSDTGLAAACRFNVKYLCDKPTKIFVETKSIPLASRWRRPLIYMYILSLESYFQWGAKSQQVTATGFSYITGMLQQSSSGLLTGLWGIWRPHPWTLGPQRTATTKTWSLLKKNLLYAIQLVDHDQMWLWGTWIVI